MNLDTDKMLAHKQDGIGWMTFNNPERHNAISYEMRVAGLTILEDFENDDAVRVIIIKGAGEKSFISGSDISQFERRAADADVQQAAADVSRRLQQRYETLSKPLVAMIQGYCLGAGLSTALLADLRIAADNAVFGIPAARLGLAYGYDNTRRLVGLIGPARAKEMLFTAKRYSASDAALMGLITEVVPHLQLEDSARKIAAAIAANAPLSVRAAKLMVQHSLAGSDHGDPALWRRIESECLQSQDHTEGRRAFSEKREPRFVGR
jgi:enoyl-CoA hydratase